MSIAGFCRPLLMTIVLAGIAAGSRSVAYAAPDACALLTAPELSAAVAALALTRASVSRAGRHAAMRAVPARRDGKTIRLL
jgi:hypothetical protein